MRRLLRVVFFLRRRITTTATGLGLLGLGRDAAATVDHGAAACFTGIGGRGIFRRVVFFGVLVGLVARGVQQENDGWNHERETAREHVNGRAAVTGDLVVRAGRAL